MKEKGIYLAVIFGVIVLINLMIEIENWDIDGYHTFSYHAPWFLVLVVFIFFFLKRIEGIEHWSFIILWFVVVALVSPYFSKINRFVGASDIVSKNIVGVHGITDYYNEQVDDVISEKERTNLYLASDYGVKMELRALKNKFGQSGYEEFIFWQSGFIRGYKHKNISNYDGSDSGSSLTLFFTVGPIFILECLIYSILNSLVYMIIPILLVVFKYECLKSETKMLMPLVDFFNNKKKRL